MPAFGRARRRGDAAALALTAVLVCGGAAPSRAQAPTQAPGPQVIVRATSGAPVVALELWFRAPSAGFDVKQTPGVARLAAQVVSASKPIVGESLDHIVGNLGGRLAISAFSDAVSVTAVVPAGGSRSVLTAMTRAYFSPVISDDGYRDAARAVSIDATIQSFNPEVVGRDGVFASLFPSGPKYYPPGGDAAGIGSIGLDAVRAFAKRAFRAQNAVVVAAGRVAPDLATAVAAGRPADDPLGAASEPPVASVLTKEPAAVTRRLEDAGGALGWAGPPILREREATALDFIADYLFRPGSGTVTAPLSEREPGANVSGQFITLHDPGVFLVTFTSTHSDEVRATIERALAGMQKPLDRATFARALDGFTARITTDVQTAAEVSDNLGWYTVEGNPSYAPISGLAQAGYFAAAASLTPGFIAETARKYLGRPGARVTFAPDPKSTPKPAKAGV